MRRQENGTPWQQQVPVTAAEQGMTLVECLAALLLLAFVVISTTGMVSYSMRLGTTGTEYSVVSNLARDRLEHLAACPYEHPDLLPDVSHTAHPAGIQASVSWQVAEHRLGPGATLPPALLGGDAMRSTAAGSGNLKLITVTVRSLAGAGLGRRTISIQSVKTRAGRQP